MTISQYISQKLKPFGTLSEAQLLGVSLNAPFNVDDEFSIENADDVARAMVGLIEELVFSPKMSSISENGFSVSWDFAGLGKYYMWLCRKYGIKPDDDTLAMLGMSAVIDKTDIW